MKYAETNNEYTGKKCVLFWCCTPTFMIEPDKRAIMENANKKNGLVICISQRTSPFGDFI